MKKSKKVIILEGADASGKSSLLQHLQNLSNGKCHTLHSNFNKELPKENHRRQHMNIAKFVSKQFSKNYYTANDMVVLDRCYISDMTYGQIGYGSRGDLNSKFRYLNRLLKIISRNKDIDIILIYCRPNKTNFDKDAKEELLTDNENDKMQSIYDSVMYNSKMIDIILDNDIVFIVYNYNTDPNYENIDKHIKLLDNFADEFSK